MARMLERDPVARFDEKNVVRMCVEQGFAIASEAEIANRVSIGTVLLPHKEQRRSRTILSKENCISSQRAEIEIRVAYGER